MCMLMQQPFSNTRNLRLFSTCITGFVCQWIFKAIIILESTRDYYGSYGYHVTISCVIIIDLGHSLFAQLSRHTCNLKEFTLI